MTEKQFLTVEQVAHILRISEQAAWVALWKGPLPYRRFEGRVIIPGDEFDKFLDALPGRSAEEAIRRLKEGRDA